MRSTGDGLLCAPSDLSNFLSCRHRAGLDLAVTDGQLTRPPYADPYAVLLREHGERHERVYVDALRASGKRVVNLDGAIGTTEQTRHAMRSGVDVIVQPYLEADGLGGVADVLMRVGRPSDLGAWSYEVHDTKLARDTTGGTIVQLSAYSDLVATFQGIAPARFVVVTPGVDSLFTVHAYRVEDYAAYYRTVLASVRSALRNGPEPLLGASYPEPVDACATCIWEPRCRERRRQDDHLSLIAGAGRSQRVELVAQGYRTLAEAAAMAVPIAFAPARGARETYERLGHQARVQYQQRATQSPVVERLPLRDGEGLCRLPDPSPGDLFLDLEGARFARDGGREFLFGVWSASGYRAWWAADDREERAAFEAVIDLIVRAWTDDPRMHVYHFNHYEPTALKKLMGRYVTRGEEIDRLLRARRFVDLYPIVRQSIRAGVESYSIKQLEQYTAYTRAVTLESARDALLAVERALDARSPAAISDDLRGLVQGYNEDDCRSTERLRDWLEGLRTQWEEADGVVVPRHDADAEDAARPVPEVQQQAVALRERILATIPADASDPGHADHARWLVAYLIDWHRRETNAEWWEYFRLCELPEEALFEERKAVAGLRFVAHVETVCNSKTGKPTGSEIHRYSYPPQDIEIKIKGSLNLQHDERFGELVAHDREKRTIDVKKGKTMVERHPSCAFSADVVGIDGLQRSVMRLAERLMTGKDDCGTQLLVRNPPRLRSGVFEPVGAETAQDFAVRVVTHLDRTALAIQGPPGAGKTYTGAQMILALVEAGKKVGVTATSHKVIRNLLDEVVAQAAKTRQPVRVGAKPDEASDVPGAIVELMDNSAAVTAICGGAVDVLGGTPFLWAREELAGTVDVLFIDEAGQMSLANALAVSQAADSMVLLGDPRQLDQPEKASHPDGVGISALEHVLGACVTMPADRGIFLPITWRMSPALTAFTSELFYEGKLTSKPGLDAQRLEGTGAYDGSRLWFVPVEHEGNQSASIEEVEAVEALVQALLTPGARWIGEGGFAKPLTGQELRVVAPFNAQVSRLTERLRRFDVPVGTVDKFQGQTAAVVIYSMTTSRPEDAPRGMEFLYSLNRLNVATSRARCAVFLVASPRLFEPECRTPRHVQLANALCRYREMAACITPRPSTIAV